MKLLRLFLFVSLVVALVGVVAPAGAQQDGVWEGWSCSAYSDMMSGEVPAIPGMAFGAYGPFEPATYTITVTAAAGDVTVSLISAPSSAPLAGPSATPVTFTYVMPADSQPEGLGIRVESASTETWLTISASCGYAGCDAFVDLPADAVVGSFVDNAPVYWAPGELIAPQVTITMGKTLWVAGQDATGMYRKVLLSCQWVWVEANKVGPNYDATWEGAPLPTTVVK